jgi:hypothetical protein
VDAVERIPVGTVAENGVVYALILSLKAPGLAVDGVVPVPGCDPRAGGHGRYWLTGTVGEDVRYLKKGKYLKEPSYRFLLTVDDLRFVGKLVASRRRVKVRPGSRVTIECVFEVPYEREWAADDLPEEWCTSWEVLGHSSGGELGYMLDLEPPSDEEVRPAESGRRTPLLLDTDYGGGPLWYRSPDNKAPWGLGLDYFPLSEALHDRLVKWTAADYHLHYDYEDDDPEHEAAWHDEGLALLADLRTELGPGYDIKFSHDLEA